MPPAPPRAPRAQPLGAQPERAVRARRCDRPGRPYHAKGTPPGPQPTVSAGLAAAPASAGGRTAARAARFSSDGSRPARGAR
eukprot:14198330-Alexandrium_andersonii.AAC.1